MSPLVAEIGPEAPFRAPLRSTPRLREDPNMLKTLMSHLWTNDSSQTDSASSILVTCSNEGDPP